MLSFKKSYSPVHIVSLLLIFLFYLVVGKVSTNIFVYCGKSLEALIVILRGIFMESSLILYIFFIMRRGNSGTMQSELGIYIRKIDILWGALAYFVSVLILLILNYFFPVRSTETRVASIINYLVNNTHYYTLSLLFVYGSLLAPIAEEILFRGFLWRILEEKKINRYIILVVTSLLFAFYHLELFMVPYLFISGLILGLLRMLTNRLGVSIVMHIISNTLAIILGAVFF